MSVTDGAVTRYKRVLYGGGVEELDRFGVRDAIRSGEITSESELAVANTDAWRPASAFPEFRRYLDLAATTSPQTNVVGITPAPKRDVQPMSTRAMQAILYPVAGGEVVALLGLAFLSMFPFISTLARLAATVIMVEIVRTSADGRTKMPLVDTSQAWQLLRTYFRVMFVTLVSLIPAYIVGVFAVVSLFQGGGVKFFVAAMALALLIAALYYPACLATVAVWDNILASLNPLYVVKVIRIIGGDYFFVIALWFGASALATLASMPAFSPFAAIPIAGPIFSAALSFWGLFYVSHLLGYAVYRHASELGWE
jgi:hypothetical protein